MFWINFKLSVRSFIRNLPGYVSEFLKWIGGIIYIFLLNTIIFARFIIYKILTKLSRLASIIFLVGFIFHYKCFVELKSGVNFFDMKNLKYSLLCILAPIALAIITEVIKPSKYMYTEDEE